MSTLAKLTIKAYSSADRTEFLPGEFTAMFNPESYSLSYRNRFARCQGINSSSKRAKYINTKPEKLSIKLIIDGTGVRDYGLDKLAKETFGLGDDVYLEVADFFEKTSQMDGTIHEPKYLRLEWGDLIFDCRMDSVTVKYTLFNSDGQPLRAELDCNFVGDIEESARLKLENKESPDMTHIREVNNGDTLSLMTKRIYGTPKYYMKIARANGLDNLRDLELGQQIYFPPIK